MPYREPNKPKQGADKKPVLLFKKSWWKTLFSRKSLKMYNGDKLAFCYIRSWYVHFYKKVANDSDGSIEDKTAWDKLWYTTKGNWVFQTKNYMPGHAHRSEDERYRTMHFWASELSDLRPQLKEYFSKLEVSGTASQSRSFESLGFLETFIDKSLNPKPEPKPLPKPKPPKQKPKVIKV